MQTLPDALASLAAYNQFILFKLVWDEVKQANRKFPINPNTLLAYPKGADWQKDPASMTDAQTALNLSDSLGPEYGVGFLFTPNDPFFFVDLDKCLNPDNVTWSPVAMDVLARLPGAAVEVSQSGRGLHIIGSGVVPEHGCKNIGLGLELYTEWRFVALTGTNAIGSASVDLSQYLPALVAGYFPPKASEKGQEWTSEPVAEWNGPEDDEELIAKARASQSAGGVFGNRSTFSALWDGDEDILAAAYPDPEGVRAFDGSSADAALAQHLAFWTGNNCDRILKLMWQSGLVRDKWHREDYLIRTITRAASLQETFYSTGGQNTAGLELAELYGAPRLRAGSDGQRNYANDIRANKLIECQGDEETIKRLCSSSGANASAKFWLDNQDKTPEQLVAMVTPIESAANPLGTATGPEIVAGHQYLGATLQLEHFAGCVYIQDLHRVFTPSGSLLKSEQFNATYGGYVFQLDETGDKTTRKAWEAFTESQIVRYPKAEAMCFRPDLPTGTLLEEEGRTLVNTYVPIETPRLQGDPTPFLQHLEKVLPDANDRAILLAYMAACVQHKGVKFQWAPLLQGAEGNGKTLFTRCVAFAVGKRYTHMPKASKLNSDFNGWMIGKLFYGVEDIYVPDHKKEVIEELKPMITGGDGLEIEKKGVDQITADICGNFIFNSNHRDAIRKTRNDRRFAVFYTAQQTAEDVIRDGMGGEYFPNLYNWLKSGGYAIVNEMLSTYPIPDELNPAGHCHRAPLTSSTDAAIAASLGGVEQEILEAIDEGRIGFAGGWVSSKALDLLLDNMRANRAIPINKRRELMQSLGYDWHPALKNGRVNNHIQIDGGKPKLFIKDGHISKNLESPAEVARVYQEAQGAPATSTGKAVEVFGK